MGNGWMPAGLLEEAAPLAPLDAQGQGGVGQKWGSGLAEGEQYFTEVGDRSVGNACEEYGDSKHVCTIGGQREAQGGARQGAESDAGVDGQSLLPQDGPVPRGGRQLLQPPSVAQWPGPMHGSVCDKWGEWALVGFGLHMVG
jgi:hypothetical protein